jgi:hypothetical protein
MKTKTENNAKQTNEQEMNLQNIIVVGECKGTYANASVTKEFQAKVLVSARPDGTVIVHNLGNGVRPLCYIDGGAEISLARNLADAEIEFFATTEDGQQLTLQFTEITAMQGVSSGKQTNSLAMSILKCVFDLGGNYGRTTIARVLTGSVSKKILTINISKLGTYGVAKESSMKEVLSLIDWLIQENYLAYVEDSEFPVLVVTSKGLDVLAGGDVPVEAQSELDIGEVERRKAVLKEWRDRKSAEMGKPRYFVLKNRTLAEIASKAPKTVEDLQSIYGIGDVVAQKYGAEILGMFNPNMTL